MTSLITRKNTVRSLLAAVVVAALAGTASATTSTDADFAGFGNKITGWLTGSLGKTIGYVGVGIGAVQLFRNQWGAAAAWIGVGLLLSLGPTVIDSIFGAII